MKSLIDIQDALSTARNFVECAFLACSDLPDEQGHPLAAVLDEAARRLSGVNVDIEHIKLEAAKTSEAKR